jgi:putative RNA 2'-phosphotransferase
MSPQFVRYSKFLSLILRHKPEKIGLQLDAQGWADVEELLAKAKAHGVALTRPQLDEMVAISDNQRLPSSPMDNAFGPVKGISIQVNRGLEPQTPPPHLYHGTATRFLESIRQQGLLARDRDYVHLTEDEETGIWVGGRHGQPVALSIQAEKMHPSSSIFIAWPIAFR